VTERQKYQVLQNIDGIEIRNYSPYVTADVLVNEDYEKAANQGFRPLANYIFGNNIAMTAPVIVQNESDESEKWQVSFVMPDGSRIEDMPAPSGAVKLRSEATEICAAIKFSGYTGRARIKKYEEKLLHVLREQNIQITGKIRIARFDPPWKPGFIRHNELIVPIKFNA
jgi:hypothetical protein